MKYLGKQVRKPSRELDIIPWKGGPIKVVIDCSEFTSHCPVTGQPDFAKLKITYLPNKGIIETKSMKIYLWTFRDEENFNETLVDFICRDLFAKVKPHAMKVEGFFNARGGISLTITAVHGKKELLA
jgi:7-cyano-7-deazaguanine reductase